MLSPSDFNNAVPQFTNGDYASNPINPQYIAEPDAVDYNRGAEPLQTLPAQWWNWFLNKFTSRFNKVNIYVKNIFNELTQLLSVVSLTPSGTEGAPTTGQLEDMFKNKYPSYLALLMYPVGSIYWTGKAPNNGGDPNVLFGGTWVQIKDRFVLAAGDIYINGAIGGKATVTLDSTQIPSHNHSGTTDVNNRGHVHEFTPTGIIGSSPGATNFQTSGMSAHTTGWVEVRPATYDTLIQSDGSTFVQTFTSENRDYMQTAAAQQKSQKLTINIEHEHAAYFTGNTNDTKGESQNHTHSYTTNSVYGNPNDSGNASAHENMPPYVVKYCWERTA